MIEAVLYLRKRKNRWWRFHCLKDVYLRAAKAGEGTSGEQRALRRGMRKLGWRGTSKELVGVWQELVALGANRTSSLQSSDLSGIELRIAELSPDSLPPILWLDFYRLCLGLGFFQLANGFREHALDAMVQNACRENASLDVLTGGLYALLERGQYAAARRCLKSMAERGCPRARLMQSGWFVETLAGQRPRDKFGFAEGASDKDLAFGDYIRGRRIALVGPVPSRAGQGPEIDGYDVVVKFGYRGGSKGRDPETQGERLDVSYYNNAQSQNLSESNFAEIFSGIDWAVCNTRKGRSFFPSDQPGLRQLTSFQWMLLDTHFNAGPNAMFDLLRFCPEGISVFNTDLMLSSGRFEGYTPKGAPPVDYTRSFIKTHDPVLQYRAIRRLWEVGELSGDKRFEEVMMLGERSYLEQLQAAHGASEQALF